MSDYILSIGAQLDASFDKVISEARAKVQSLVSEIGKVKINAQIDTNKIKETVNKVGEDLKKVSDKAKIKITTEDVARVGNELKNWDNLLKYTSKRLQSITEQALKQKELTDKIKNNYFDWKNTSIGLNRELLFSNSILNKSNEEIKNIVNTNKNWNDVLKLLNTEKGKLLTSLKNEVITSKEYEKQLNNIRRIENIVYTERFNANKESINQKIQEYIANQKYIQALTYISKEENKLKGLIKTGVFDKAQYTSIQEFFDNLRLRITSLQEFTPNKLLEVGNKLKNWKDIISISQGKLNEITREFVRTGVFTESNIEKYGKWLDVLSTAQNNLLLNSRILNQSNEEIKKILKTTQNWDGILKSVGKEKSKLFSAYKQELITAKDYEKQLNRIRQIENLVYTDRFNANKQNIRGIIDAYKENLKYSQALDYINREERKIRTLYKEGKIDYKSREQMLSFLRGLEKDIYTTRIKTPITLYSLEDIKNISTYNNLLKAVRDNINKITKDYASGKITLSEYNKLLEWARTRERGLLARRDELLTALQSQATTILATYKNLNPMINMVKTSMDQLVMAYLSGDIKARQYTQQMRVLTDQLTRLNTANILVGNSVTSLIYSFGKMVMWTTIGMAVYAFIGAIGALGEELKNIDKETKNLNKVLRDEIDIWYKVIEASNEAKLAYSRLRLGEIGAETAAGLQTALKTQIDFVRAGFSLAESIDLTRSALMAQNVAEMTVTESTKAFIAVIHQFNLSAFQSIEVLNKWNEITNKIGGTTKDLAASVERAGSTWLLANKNMQSSFTTLNAVTVAIQKSTGRAGGEIGTAIRSIAVNYMDLAKRGTTVAQVLRTVGIEIMKNKDEYKPLIEVLSELATKWSSLSEVQKANISRVFAMKWHYSTFNALLNSFSQVTLAVVTQLRSANSAYKENQIYLERLDARLNLLKVSWEKIVLGPGSAFLNLLKGLIDTLRYFLTGLTVLPANLMVISGAVIFLLGYLNTLKNVLIGIGMAASLAGKANLAIAGLQAAFVLGSIAIGKYKDSQEAARREIELQIETIKQQNNLLKETSELLPFLVSEYQRISNVTETAKNKIDELKDKKIRIQINSKEIINDINNTINLMNEKINNSNIINLKDLLSQDISKTVKFNIQTDKTSNIQDIIKGINIQSAKISDKKIKFTADNTEVTNKINEINQQINNQSKIYRENTKIRIELEKYFNELAKTLNIQTLQEYLKANKARMSAERATGEYIKQVQTAIKNKTIQTNIEIARSYMKLASSVTETGAMTISTWDIVVAGFVGYVKGIAMTIYNLFLYAQRLAIGAIQNILGGIKNVLGAINTATPNEGLTITINSILSAINSLERMKATPISWKEIFGQGAAEIEKIEKERYQKALLLRNEYLQKALSSFGGIGGYGPREVTQEPPSYSGGQTAGDKAKKDKEALGGVGGALDNIIERWIELKKRIKENIDNNKDFVKTFEDYNDANLKLKELRSNLDIFKDLDRIFGLRQQQSILEKTLSDLMNYFKEKNTGFQQIYKDITSKEVNLNNELKRTADEYYNINKNIISITTSLDNLFNKASQVKNLKTEELQNLITNLKEVASGDFTSKGIAGYTWKEMGLKTVGTSYITKDVEAHKYPKDVLATDYGAALGTPIKALTTGKVIRTGVLEGYGNIVEILYKDIDNIYRTVLYAHLKDINVKTGQQIKSGEIIGTVGSTGSKSTGPHLHLEFRKASDKLVEQYKITQASNRFALSKIIEEELSSITKKYPKWTTNVEDFKRVLKELKQNVLEEFDVFKRSQNNKTKLIEQTIQKYNELKREINNNQKQFETLDSVVTLLNKSLEENNNKYKYLSDIVSNIIQNNINLKTKYAELNIEFDNSKESLISLNNVIDLYNKKIELLEENIEIITKFQRALNIIDTSYIDNIINSLNIPELLSKLGNKIQQSKETDFITGWVKSNFANIDNKINEYIPNIISGIKNILPANTEILKSLGITDEQINTLRQLNQEEMKYIKTVTSNILLKAEESKRQEKENKLNQLITQQNIIKTQEQNKNNLVLEQLKRKELEYTEVLLKQNIILENTGIARQFKIEQLNILNELLQKEIENLKQLNELEKSGVDVLSNKLQVTQKINEYQSQIISINKEINKLPQIIQTATDEINNLIYDSLNLGILDLLKNREKEIIEGSERLTAHLKSREEIFKNLRGKIVPLTEGEQFRNEITNTIEELKKSYIEEWDLEKQLEVLKNPFVRLKEYLSNEFAPKVQEIFVKAITEGITEGLQIKQTTADFIRQVILQPLGLIKAEGITVETQSKQTQEAITQVGQSILASIPAILSGYMFGNTAGTIVQGGKRREGSEITSLIGTIVGGTIGSLFGPAGTFIGAGLGGFAGGFIGGKTETEKYIQQQNEALYKSIRALQENTKQLINLNDTYKSLKDITAEIIPAPASAYYAGRIAPTDLNIKVYVESNNEMFAAKVTEVTSNNIFNSTNLMRWF